MRVTVPTAITFFRVFLIPVFVVIFYLPYSWTNVLATAVFALASISDWLDGYLARSMQQESRFGAFLDPVADKLIVAVAIVLIVQQNPTIWVALPSLVIILREILVSALREWMAEIGDRGKVKVSWIGKLKTTVQLVSLLMLIFAESFLGLPIFEIGLALFYLAAFLTVLSMVNYLRAAWPSMVKHS